jgi:hypothetical protein
VFNWLFKGSGRVSILLASVALALLVIWWRTRQRRWLIAANIAPANDY